MRTQGVLFWITMAKLVRNTSVNTERTLASTKRNSPRVKKAAGDMPPGGYFNDDKEVEQMSRKEVKGKED